MADLTSGGVPSPVAVAPEAVDGLRRRLADARLPGPASAGWTLGPDAAFLAEFCRYWGEEFDWVPWQHRINDAGPTMVDVGGVAIHCLHVRSRHATARPLLLTHGWPGSIVEMLGLIGPLTDPTRHGGQAADAFHVVIPSLPGYGFSPAPPPGTSIRVVGTLLARLMAALGYERFLAQGGDWGAIATSYLAIDHPERVDGIHLNTVLAYPPADGDPTEGLTPAELEQLARFGTFAATGMAYIGVHATRPYALAPGLDDSPVGLAAWILDKFWAWSDNDGTLPGPFTLDVLAANLSVYWHTRTIASSIRLYTDSIAAGEMGPLPSRVEVATGCALFPCEILVPARRWADAAYNVTQWSVFDRGGHFAALEQPDALVGDVRRFAASLGR